MGQAGLDGIEETDGAKAERWEEYGLAGTRPVCECGHIMVVHTCFKRREDNHCHDGCECQEYVEAKMAEPEVVEM